ncbi:MAG: hypothetical protein AAGA55_09920 [Planctomycetota bacterium]
MTDGAPSSEPALADPVLGAYLGRDAGAGGPFALLGLAYDFQGDRAIAAAVRRRLIQLDRHPLRQTPEADEVRLAVHTAAAQLADPELRAALADRWPPGSAAPIPRAWRRRVDAVSPALAAQAAMIVGSCGGWNERAKKRLAYIARVHRVGAFELIQALAPASGARASGPMLPVPAPVRSGVAPLPPASGMMWLALHGALAAMLLLMVGLSIAELRAIPADDDKPPATVALGEQREDNGSLRSVPGPRERILHHTAMTQELRNTTLVAVDRPNAAMDRAARVIGSFLAGWQDAPAPARDQIVELLLQIAAEVTQASAPIDAWVAVLERGRSSTDPSEQAAALALLHALSFDERVSLRARDRFQTVGAPPVGEAVGAFDARLFAILASIGLNEPGGSKAWWSRWSGAVVSCAAARRSDRDALVLDVIASRLGGSLPIDDEIWRPVVSTLAGMLEWRAGSPARVWLLDRFTDADVPSARLAVLTEVLATEVSVPGVDITMVLDPTADLTARAGLAEAYRRAWVSARGAPSPLQGRIADRLREAVRAGGAASSFRERLVAIELLARANAAAALDFESDAVAASEMVEPPAPIPAGVSNARRRSLGDDWAVRLLNAEDDSQTRSVLAEARGAELIHTAATALVQTAFRGPGRASRDRARLMILARAASPTVLLAMDREIGDRPKRAVIDLAGELLGTDFRSSGSSPDQLATTVRAALLAAAAEFAGGVPPAAEYAELGYRDALVRRASLESAARSSAALAVIVDRWRDRGAIEGPWRIDVVMPALSAMVAVSETTGQLQAAYHLAVVRLMAGSIVERGGVPARSVQRVMMPLRVEWSGARSAAAQMLASQRAEAMLWLLFLEGTP